MFFEAVADDVDAEIIYPSVVFVTAGYIMQMHYYVVVSSLFGFLNLNSRLPCCPYAIQSFQQIVWVTAISDQMNCQCCRNILP